MPDNFKNSRPIKFIFELVQRRDGSVVYPVAAHASDVIMPVRIPVIAFQSTAKFQFLDFSHFDEDFKISINSAETDPGYAPAYHLINFICAGMFLLLLQLFKDDLALPGHSNVLGLEQIVTPGALNYFNNSIYIFKENNTSCQVSN